jgi:hypothetical protein
MPRRNPEDGMVPGEQVVKRGGPSGNGVYQSARFADYLIDVEKRLVVVRFGKRLKFSDIELYAMMLRANPSFQPHFSEIADLSQVEHLDVDADEFLKLADQSDPFDVAAKRAFVARNPVQTHAAQMHKILRGQRNFEIFETLEEAEKWMGK